MSRRIRQAQDTLIAAEAARLDPFKRPPVDLARILRDFGHKPPYHIADVVEFLDSPIWASQWPESAQRAFVAALVGTPAVTTDMAKRFHTGVCPAVTADMAPYSAYRSWWAYGDTICDDETHSVHQARRRLAIAAAIAELRKLG